jgi:hypothetical protein
MDPLLPLTIAAIGIAALAPFRSRWGVCSILGASLVLMLLMLVTQTILWDNHPYSPNGRILSDAAVASFHGRALARTEVGNEAELAVDTLPGRVLKGHLRGIVSATASASPGSVEQEVFALIDLQPGSDADLLVGARAQVVVYTRNWRYVGVVRRLLLRMHSWQNYLVLHSNRHFTEARDWGTDPQRCPPAYRR